MTVYAAGTTPALSFARQSLAASGIYIAEEPGLCVDHLLLDVPSFRPNSSLHLGTLLAALPGNVRVWGGNLDHPALEGYRCVDLLKKEEYLQKNAEITAVCTLPLIASLVKNRWQGLNALILGWGRIAKALAPLLTERGVRVSAAARKASDRREIAQQGFQALDISALKGRISSFGLIVNTVPAPVLEEAELTQCPGGKIDLASVKGLIGGDVVWARGLPGVYAPEESGALIARMFQKLVKEEQS